MFGNSPLTGADARRARSRREMWNAILDEAGRIVESDGIDALTIRAVAQAIGYSPGAIYEYFDSKEAILSALYFGGADGLGAVCERAVTSLPTDTGAVDALVALGHAYRNYALKHPDLYRLVFGGLKAIPKERPPDCEEQEGGFDTVLEIARRGVESGEFASIPLPMIAVTAWAAVHGYVSLELTGHLKGGDAPGAAPATPDEGLRQRDNLFDAHMRMIMLGLVREEHRPAVTAVLA